MKNQRRSVESPLAHKSRIHGKAPKNITKLIHHQVGKNRTELKNILRWEDDGGQNIQVAEVVKIVGFGVGKSEIQKYSKK